MEEDDGVPVTLFWILYPTLVLTSSCSAYHCGSCKVLYRSRVVVHLQWHSVPEDPFEGMSILHLPPFGPSTVLPWPLSLVQFSCLDLSSIFTVLHIPQMDCF